MLRRWVPLSVALMAVLIAVGCSSAPPTHYYASGSDWAIYLAWTEDTTGHLQGQVQVIAADPNDPAKLKSTNAAFTGTRNGEDISIAFPLLSNALGATWTGTVSNNSISLVIPTAGLPSNPTLNAGSFADFQKAAQKVQVGVGVAQQQQAQQQAVIAQQQAQQQAAVEQQNQHDRQVSIASSGANEAASKIKEGYAEVKDALNELATDVPATPSKNGLSAQYAAEWVKMQDVWAQEQAAAQVTPMTCYQKGQVSYVAGQVSYELGQFNYLDGQTKYTLNQIQTYVNSANEGLNTVSQWAPVLFQKAQDYSQLSGQPSTVPDPTTSVAGYRKMTEDSLEMYASRIERLLQVVKSYDERAQELDDKAKAFPQSISCSG